MGAKPLYLCFLDLRNAFDTVPRKLLFKILFDAGINGKILRVIQDLFSSNRANVLIDGYLSRVFYINKSSLSLGRTSAGIVCCFWGIFDTVRSSHIIKCVFTFLSQNPKHLEYKKYVQSKSGN